ncbi:hypothetical protein BGX33_006500 [Mortierella sp. NVP41]|nr:hypothetical protein BGX33_006500 [Mortierella sp. NVP41]
MAPQPTVLVLGGVGFIGRNFVAHLVENGLAADIRVVDKALPQTAYFNDRFKAAFDKVDFLQGDLSNTIPPEKFEKMYTRADGSSFDYVINFASETRFSQPPELYEERVYKLSLNCANQAVKKNCKVFVQVSTGDIYKSVSTPSKETSETGPWNDLAKYKLKVDEELKNMPGLNLVILRPAVVYGIGAMAGLTPRLICGRVYKKKGEKMEFLWTGDLKLNTVHVKDVVSAVWHSANWYVSSDNKPPGTPVTFNLADQNDTDQEAVNKHIQSIFGIETGFKGTIFSEAAMAALDKKEVAEETNDMHLGPWADILKTQNIKSSPLTPYLDADLLAKNSLSLDGTQITVTTGFKYEHPKLTEQSLREIISDFQDLGIWPRD